MMNFNKNKSKKDLVKSLNSSLEMNKSALDYIENEISRNQDILNFNENDVITKENLNCLKYIKLSLKHIEDCYNNALKRLVV